MRGTITVSSMAVETSDGEMVRAVLRNLVGFLREKVRGMVAGMRGRARWACAPFLPHVDCHRNQAVLVWGTSRAPLPIRDEGLRVTHMPKTQVNGIDLYYEVHGDGPAIVFAHGAGGNHLSWWQQVPVFARSIAALPSIIEVLGNPLIPRMALAARPSSRISTNCSITSRWSASRWWLNQWGEGPAWG